MKFFLLIVLLITKVSFSQTNLDFGKVSGSNVCADSVDPKICQSKNQLEIQLTRVSGLTGIYDRVFLFYDGFKWKAKKEESDLAHSTIKAYALKPLSNFDTIFNVLKSNKIFILPDQQELKNVQGSVDDGYEYTLFFKAGDQFRVYEFNNPDIYITYNKNITEFTNYLKIVEILFSGLKEE